MNISTVKSCVAKIINKKSIYWNRFKFSTEYKRRLYITEQLKNEQQTREMLMMMVSRYVDIQVESQGATSGQA